MNHCLRRVVLSAILCLIAVLVALASARWIPLPELVKTSDSIITGRIIKTEKTEIREGVHEVVCHIRVNSVLKGEPTTDEKAISGKQVKIVHIQFFDGKGVPTGKVVYDLGEEGIWFLALSKTSLHGVHARRNLSERDAVRKELQDKIFISLIQMIFTK